MTEPITKTEFKRRWDLGHSLSWDDIAQCAKDWGLYSTPEIRPMDHVVYAVLEMANANYYQDFKPKEEHD